VIFGNLDVILKVFLAVGIDANDQTLLQRGALLKCVSQTLSCPGVGLLADCQLFETRHQHDFDLSGPALAEYSLCRVQEKAYDA